MHFYQAIFNSSSTVEVLLLAKALSKGMKYVHTYVPKAVLLHYIASITLDTYVGILFIVVFIIISV